MVTRAWLLASMAGMTLACSPDFSDTTAIVTAPRLLAVQAAPAEGPTGTDFTMTSLYVGPEGATNASALRWATCMLQAPLNDPDPVNPACLGNTSTGVVPLGSGASVRGSIPSNACELFGPESPPPPAGQPAARPTDPDSTGGYYLPVRIITADASDSVAFERISCQPSGVVESVFTAFSMGYVPNENPVVSSLALVMSDGGVTPIAPDALMASAPVAITAGSVVPLQVAWPSCPKTPTACGGAETYLLIDPSTKTLTTARESMVVSWYATAGSFLLDRVGRDADDPETSVANTWTAPTTLGLVHVWIVLRDARGGVGWTSYSVTVTP